MLGTGAGGPGQCLEEGVRRHAGQPTADCCEGQQPGETSHRPTIFGSAVTSLRHPFRKMGSP